MHTYLIIHVYRYHISILRTYVLNHEILGTYHFFGRSYMISKQLPAPPEPNGSPFELVLVGATGSKAWLQDSGAYQHDSALAIDSAPAIDSAKFEEEAVVSTGRFFEFAQR
jgi:hypothetical protein